MKKYFFGFIFSFLLTGFSVAQQIDHFEIEIDPNPTTVNVANDVIIKAVDVEGNIVEDYVGDALFLVYDEQGNEITDLESIPGDGIITFNIEDQGIKRYSKSLVFTDPGVYEIEVVGATDENVKGTTSITVNEEGTDKNNDITIKIISPVDGSTETNLPIDIIVNTSSPNTIYKIFLDGDEYSNGLTDENGQIQDSIKDIQPGQHQLQIKLYDADNNKIAASDIINFKYNLSDQDLFEKIDIIPSNEVYQGEKVEIKVYTKGKVDDVVLVLSDKNENVIFSKKMEYDGQIYKLSLTPTNIGKYNISLKIINNGQTKEYTNVSSLNVKEKPQIYNVQVNKNIEQKSAKLIWNYKGEVSAFKILYGEDQNNLNMEKIVSQPVAEFNNLDITKSYYFKIYPLNNFGQIIGEPSDIIIVNFGKGAPVNCDVQNLKLEVQQIDGKNYLVWDKGSNVEKYIIYKAEDVNGEPGNFIKIAETTDNKWEYPFDKNAKKEIYAYFKVVGICKDNREYQIGDVKKVKVGPMNTILMAILLFIFIYSGYYIYSKLRD